MRSSTARPRRSRPTGAVLAAAVLVPVLGASATTAAATADSAYAAEEAVPADQAPPAGEAFSAEEASPAEETTLVEDAPPVEDTPPAGEDPPGGEQLPDGEHQPGTEQPPDREHQPGAEQPPPGGIEFNPATVSAGAEVTVNTTVCGPGQPGTGDASSLSVGDFTMEASTHREVLVGRFTVPAHTVEGEYAISVFCADGGKSAKGALWVTAGGGPSPNPTGPGHPTGHVRTGVGGGTSAGPDTPQIAAGAAFLAASAVGGTWLLRRRASGTR